MLNEPLEDKNFRGKNCTLVKICLNKPARGELLRCDTPSLQLDGIQSHADTFGAIFCTGCIGILFTTLNSFPRDSNRENRTFFSSFICCERLFNVLLLPALHASTLSCHAKFIEALRTISSPFLPYFIARSVPKRHLRVPAVSSAGKHIAARVVCSSFS